MQQLQRAVQKIPQRVGLELRGWVTVQVRLKAGLNLLI
jgi:hypothetical protein